MHLAERPLFFMQYLPLGRHDDGYSLLINLLQFVGVCITGIGAGCLTGCFHPFISLINLTGKLISVVDLIGCFYLHNKSIFVIHDALDIITGMAALNAVHHSTIRIGLIDLLPIIWFERVQDFLDSFFQVLALNQLFIHSHIWGNIFFSLIGGLAINQQLLNTTVELGHEFLIVGPVMGAISSGIRPNLRSVNKEHVSGNQIQFDAHLNTLMQNLLQCFLIVTPELGYGLMIRLQSAHQPDKGYIMITFPLQFPWTLHTIGIAINQQLEHGARIVFGVAYFIRIDVYTQLLKIKSFYKKIISPDWIIFAYILFYALRH